MPVAKTSPAAAAPVRATPPASPGTGKPAARKAAVKQVAVKAAAKAATKAPARRTPFAKAVEPASPPAVLAKPPKLKLVRDSFTIPRAEYAVLDALKERLVKLTRPAKKSEVLRAGIAVLSTLTDAALLAALEAVPAIKTGRPKKPK